eukprot:260095-Hanusia_phi.AAC.1
MRAAPSSLAAGRRLLPARGCRGAGGHQRMREDGGEEHEHGSDPRQLPVRLAGAQGAGDGGIADGHCVVGLTRGELQVATGRSEEVVAVVVEEEVGKRGG